MGRFRTLVGLALVGLLGGCEVSPGPAAKMVCPPVKSFSSVWQMELRNELQAIPQNWAMNDALLDWSRMRDDARACKGDQS